MATLHYHHHNIKSLNPSWFLIRPVPDKDIVKRLRHAAATTTTTLSSHANKKNQHHKCSTADDPSSPRINCMGNLKGNKPTSHGSTYLFPSLAVVRTTTSTASSEKNKLSKLTRVFFGRRRRSQARTRVGDVPRSVLGVVNVTELDPPLPVVRREATRNTFYSVSLWERRCGVKALEGLQLQRQ